MKLLIYTTIILTALCSKLSAQVFNNGYHIIGIDARADRNVTKEFHYAYLSTRSSLGFGIKLAKYTFDNDYPSTSFSNNYLPGISAKDAFTIDGIALKAGLVLGKKIKEYFVFYHDLYLVGTRNQNVYSITFTDPSGVYTSSYPSSIHYTYGFEYEAYVALRVLDNFLISAAGQFGMKNGGYYISNDVISNLPVYHSYAPAQGYSIFPLYFSGSVGISFMF